MNLLTLFDDSITNKERNGIQFSLSDHCQLIGWTGRAVRKNNRGSIPDNLPPILAQLNIPIEDWLINSLEFEKGRLMLLQNLHTSHPYEYHPSTI